MIKCHFWSHSLAAEHGAASPTQSAFNLFPLLRASRLRARRETPVPTQAIVVSLRCALWWDQPRILSLIPPNLFSPRASSRSAPNQGGDPAGEESPLPRRRTRAGQQRGGNGGSLLPTQNSTSSNAPLLKASSSLENTQWYPERRASILDQNICILCEYIVFAKLLSVWHLLQWPTPTAQRLGPPHTQHLSPKAAGRTNQVVSPNRADAAGGREEEQAGEDLAVHVHLHMSPPDPPAKGKAWSGALGPAQTIAVHAIHTIFCGGLALCTPLIQGQGPHVSQDTVPLKAPGCSDLAVQSWAARGPNGWISTTSALTQHKTCRHPPNPSANRSSKSRLPTRFHFFPNLIWVLNYKLIMGSH